MTSKLPANPLQMYPSYHHRISALLMQHLCDGLLASRLMKFGTSATCTAAGDV